MKNTIKSLTLVEVLISLVILSVVSYIVIQVYVTNQRFVQQNSNEMYARTSARQVYSYLKHDIREAFTNVSNTTLDSDSDSIVINSLAGNITYMFQTGNDDLYLLKRDGTIIAQDLNKLTLNTTVNGVEVDIEAKGESFYGQSHIVKLKQIINKRN